MQKRLAELMKEETAANRQAERAKLEEQISMLKQTLEVETSKRLTARTRELHSARWEKTVFAQTVTYR